MTGSREMAIPTRGYITVLAGIVPLVTSTWFVEHLHRGSAFTM